MELDGFMTKWLRQHQWVIIACMLSMILQVIVVVRSPVVARDSMKFIRMSQGLTDWQNTIKRNSQHPGYPIMIRGVWEFISSVHPMNSPEGWVLAARLVNLVVGVGCVYLVWLLAGLAFNPQSANFSAYLFAVIPVVRGNAADALSDTSYLFFYLLGAYIVATGLKKGSYYRLATAGILSGLAFWIRPEGWSIAIVTAAMLIFVKDISSQFRRWSAAAIVLCAAYVVSAPYIYSMKTISRKITEKSNLVYLYGNNSKKGEKKLHPVNALKQSESGSEQSKSTSRVTKIVQLAASGVTELVVECGQRLHFILILCAIAIFNRQAHRDKQIERLLIFLSVFHCLLLVELYIAGGYIDKRHLLSLAGVLTPFAGVGLTVLAICSHEFMQRLIPGNKYSRFAEMNLAYPSLAIIFLIMIPLCIRPLHQQYKTQLSAAKWLKEHSTSEDSLISNSVYVEFYSGLKSKTELKPKRLKRVVSSDKQSRFFVIDRNISSNWSGVDQALSVAQYQPVVQFSDPRSQKTHTVQIYANKSDPIFSSFRKNLNLVNRPVQTSQN